MCRRREKLKMRHRHRRTVFSFNLARLDLDTFRHFKCCQVSVDWRAAGSEALPGASGLYVTQMLQIV